MEGLGELFIYLRLTSVITHLLVFHLLIVYWVFLSTSLCRLKDRMEVWNIFLCLNASRKVGWKTEVQLPRKFLESVLFFQEYLGQNAMRLYLIFQGTIFFGYRTNNLLYRTDISPTGLWWLFSKRHTCNANNVVSTLTQRPYRLEEIV